jgi:prevent-host-death family protein
MKKIGMEVLRKTMGEVMIEVKYCNERYVVTRNFKPVGVLISWDDWKMFEEMIRENDEKRTLKE